MAHRCGMGRVPRKGNFVRQRKGGACIHYHSMLAVEMLNKGMIVSSHVHPSDPSYCPSHFGIIVELGWRAFYDTLLSCVLAIAYLLQLEHSVHRIPSDLCRRKVYDLLTQQSSLLLMLTGGESGTLRGCANFLMNPECLSGILVLFQPDKQNPSGAIEADFSQLWNSQCKNSKKAGHQLVFPFSSKRSILNFTPATSI